MLGSFHTFMNLLGAIGTLMEGSGLGDIPEVIYGKNVVVHMLTGKSVQRAFRAHLVGKCPNKLIVFDLMEKDVTFSSLVMQAEQMYTSVVDNNTNLEFFGTSDIFTDIMHLCTYACII